MLITEISPSQKFALACAKIAEEKKGSKIAILYVQPLIGITDYFIILSAENRPQAQAIAHEIQKVFYAQGRKAMVEGFDLGWWVLLDYGDIVIHIMQPEARAYYDLDNLWADAENIPFNPQDPQSKAI